MSLIAAALVLVVVSNAQSQEGEGPIPGSIAEEIPEPQATEEMTAEGQALSAGQINTPEPEHANQFAFEGPEANATSDVAGTNINDANLQGNGGLDVPTGSAPSPLFNAVPFTQQMLRFEEFGPVPLGPEASVVAGSAFPAPADAASSPAGPAVDGFLGQYITPTQALPSPFPTRMANDPDNGGTDENPWKTQIESFLGRSLNTPPAEGRPPGEDWAHQRYQEFFPQVYFNTAMDGARTNSGLRDPLQLHHYNVGEWAPGGLYHNTVGVAGFEGTVANIAVKFHPNFPVQDPNALWTWDGTFPPKLLQARYGEPIMMRHYNALPIDPAANFGFGLHTISTHEHNGHNPAESDGYTQAFFFPGQFYDYHWPMVIAGHDSINTAASDPRAGAPDGNGGIKNLQGNWRETMSTHWFHDHMLDFTATNVYKGNAAMMNYYSSLDRGHETLNDGVNLRFPSGTALDWGNRDYDINLVIADKAWDAEGQLFFNIFNLDGWLGDQILTNWLWKPFFEVRARRYRLRLLNGSVSRYIRIALVEQVDGGGGELAGPDGSGVSYNRVPFHMIANDGNIMEHAVYFDGNKTVGGLTNRKGILPTQAIAERYDIIVDFAQFAPGTKLYMVNLLEHDNGRRPNEEIPLEDVLDGSYAPEIQNGRNETDPAVTAFMEFRVQAYEGVDPSMNPADFVAGGNKMIDLPSFTDDELANAVHRTFEFVRSNSSDSTPWTIKTDGGSGFSMDPRRLSGSVTDSRVEIWHIEGNGGWSHPIHVHFEEGQIFKRGGVDPPEWEQWARKDVYRIGRMEDSTASVDIAIRFREFLGTFMEHCHNTQHEDHAMLLRWDIENPGQVRIMPTPMPTWDGVGYVPSYALPTFRDGDLEAAADSADDPDFGRLGGGDPPPPPVNNPPVANADLLTTTVDTPITFSFAVLLANDVDPDGDPLSISALDGTSVNGGTLSTPGNGTITYTPPAGFEGSDAFDYSVTDGEFGDTATVTISVEALPPPPPNSPPAANTDAFTTSVDTAITVSFGVLLANDVDPDDDPLFIVAIDGTSLNGGTVTDNGDATLTYAPPAGFDGSDSFSYTITDGEFSDTASVIITVEAVVADVLTVTKAELRVNQDKWRIEGTSSVPGPGNFVTIYLGPTVGGTVIGNAQVSELGLWLFRTQGGPIIPAGGETTISLQSTAGGVLEGFPIEFK